MLGSMGLGCSAKGGDTLFEGLVSHHPLKTNSLDIYGSNDGIDTDITYSNGMAVFNGSTSYINLGASLPIGDFTYSFFIDTTGMIATDSVLIGVGKTIGTLLILYGNTTYGTANNQLRIYSYNSEVGIGSDIRNTGIRHIVYKKEGDLFTIVVDKVTDVSGTIAGTPETTVRLGNSEYNSEFMLDARLSNVRVYSDAKDQEFINLLYTEGA